MIIYAPEIKEFIGPLLFLAGPIQGAENWQKTASDFILKKRPDINIANPRGDYSDKKFNYDNQVDFESHYLKLASKSAGIIFWLAKEKEHRCDRCYAQTTRFELSEWLNKYRYDKTIKIFIGIELGFSGERYMRKRISKDFPEITVSMNLEMLCNQVINQP